MVRDFFAKINIKTSPNLIGIKQMEKDPNHKRKMLGSTRNLQIKRRDKDLMSSSFNIHISYQHYSLSF